MRTISTLSGPIIWICDECSSAMRDKESAEQHKARCGREAGALRQDLEEMLAQYRVRVERELLDRLVDMLRKELAEARHRPAVAGEALAILFDLIDQLHTYDPEGG